MAKKKRNLNSSTMTEPKAVRGLKLIRTLSGHTDWIGGIEWSPDGRMLASTSKDRTIKIWNTQTGQCLHTLRSPKGGLNSIAFDPTSQTIAAFDFDQIKLWKTDNGKPIGSFSGGGGGEGLAFDPSGRIIAVAAYQVVNLFKAESGRLLETLEIQAFSKCYSIAFDPSGRVLAAGCENEIRLWETQSWRLLHSLKSNSGEVYSISFDPTGRTLATSGHRIVQMWSVDDGRLIRTLEGHTGLIDSLAFSNASPLLASRSNDRTIRLWHSSSGHLLKVITPRKDDHRAQYLDLAFHPRHAVLAISVSDAKASNPEIIQIWELDLPILLKDLPNQTNHYVNARVVLLGDTGVGKSGLSLVLNNQPFEATDSTCGRKVWTLQSEEVEVADNVKQTRETLLWDMAGQPGYRVIHQLHLNEVALALLVFDARSEIDPLAGVRHWERALKLAQQRQGSSAAPMKKFLVSARTDRGTVSVSKERLEALLKECGFDKYFETSAKEGWQIRELQDAIKDAIQWELLPEVTSSLLFANIKNFLLDVKKTGRLIAPATELYDDFVKAHASAVAEEPNLNDQFETCIGRLENRDLIRRLSFGGYVLLQPELLDAYASAMVNAAKEEPDGLGSIAEDVALAGQFYVPDEQKIKNRGHEQLLLHATVEELARYDLALKESAEDGRYLVFPSQFNRDYEAAPEPKGKAVAISFEGPVQSLYSTLAVRLGHSGLFTTGRAEMWRNAAVFTAKAGGKCGLYLHEFAEARGRLVVFYDEVEGRSPSDETRFHFEEFVLSHVQRRALDGTVNFVRFFVCENCGDPVPDSYVNRLRERGIQVFDCPCGSKVSLAEPKERLRYASKVVAMDRSADRQRDFEMFIESARGETSTPSFTAWAGDERVTLAIVFTDIVGSTAMAEELKDAGMEEVRRAHFVQSRKLINQFNGREIKTIGDSFMAAFRSVPKALDYASNLQADPGHPRVKIRAGIHIGPMQVEENDVFGGAVNFAARVVGSIKGPEIWLSDGAKKDMDAYGAKQHKQLKWKAHAGVEMKGFLGTFTLWSLEK